jgi:hypothetical protein
MPSYIQDTPFEDIIDHMVAEIERMVSEQDGNKDRCRANLLEELNGLWGGSVIYYEGNDPDGFVAEIKEKFGFDPSADDGWLEDFDGRPMLRFFCPARLYDGIYCSGKYPMGS